MLPALHRKIVTTLFLTKSGPTPIDRAKPAKKGSQRPVRISLSKMWLMMRGCGETCVSAATYQHHFQLSAEEVGLSNTEAHYSINQRV